MSEIFGIDPDDMPKPEEIKEWFARTKRAYRYVRDFFRSWRPKSGGDEIEKPSSRVLIAGAAGTGKTTLGSLLCGEFNLLENSPMHYLESYDVETKVKEEDVTKVIDILPGQDWRRDDWNTYLNRMKEGEYSGLILMNAFGYHSIGETGFAKLKKDYGTSTRDGFLSRYLGDRRQKELDIIGHVLPYAVNSDRERIWILSVIGKKDLWLQNKKAEEEVTSHYHGTYKSAIDLLLNNPANNTTARHEFCFASLVIQKFMVGRSDLLLPNVQGFDHNDQIASTLTMFDMIDALLKWESK